MEGNVPSGFLPECPKPTLGNSQTVSEPVSGEGVVGRVWWGLGGSVTLGEIGVFCVPQGVKGDRDLGNV